MIVCPPLTKNALHFDQPRNYTNFNGHMAGQLAKKTLTCIILQKTLFRKKCRVPWSTVAISLIHGNCVGIWVQ